MTVSRIALCALLSAALAHYASGRQQFSVLPEKITIFVDASLPVPAAVAPMVQPVKAGAEVYVRSVVGDKVKIAHGVGEGLVDISSTDFIKRAETAQAEAARIQASTAATQQQKPTVAQGSPAQDNSLLGLVSEVQDKGNQIMRNDGQHEIRLRKQQMDDVEEYYKRGMRDVEIAKQRLNGAKKMGEIGPIRYRQEMERINDVERDLKRDRQRLLEGLQHEVSQTRQIFGGAR